MKIIKLLTALSATALLASCSATPEECNPNVEQSIWGKMACVNSGSYDLQNNAALLKQKAKGNSEVLAKIQEVEQQMSQVNTSDASDEAKAKELQALQRKLAAYKKALAIK